MHHLTDGESQVLLWIFPEGTVGQDKVTSGTTQDRTIFLTPLQDSWHQAQSGIKSSISSHMDKITVALFAQLKSLAMYVYYACVRSLL
jgi:hypothetical protein